MSDQTQDKAPEQSTDSTTDSNTVPADKYEQAIERARNFEGKLADLETRFKGIDPDSVSQMQQELRELKENKATQSPEDLEAYKAELKQELENAYKEQFTEKDTSINSLMSELKELRITSKATEIMSKEFTTDGIQLLTPRIEQACDLLDGKVIVKGEDGKPLRSKKVPAENMGLSEYIESLKESYPSTVKADFKSGHMYQGNKSTSSSSSSDSGQGLDEYMKMNNEERKKAFTPQQRTRFAREMSKARRSGELN